MELQLEIGVQYTEKELEISDVDSRVAFVVSLSLIWMHNLVR
jgi:hypothetical protein